MEKIKHLVYDEGDDSLTFIKDNSGVNTINTGLSLITLNKNGLITALELMGASKNFKIPKHVLEAITRARVTFNFNNEKKRLMIVILLTYHHNQEAPVVISEDVAQFKDLFIKPQKLMASITV
ncbi:hypothetical protein HZB02_00820 [Candidatus Woesearchaeota archaeon]|nr:hypothetical protein [Candidatus Woesearchaeota archaeon]